MPAVQALLQSAVLKHLKSVGGKKGCFYFCHSHAEGCQKGHSRSVVKSKWTINFKNNSEPSTPKLSRRQQPSKTTFQMYKTLFIPQEVTRKKNQSILVWQIPGGAFIIDTVAIIM